jgi:hypothetical protein
MTKRTKTLTLLVQFDYAYKVFRTTLSCTTSTYV